MPFHQPSPPALAPCCFFTLASIPPRSAGLHVGADATLVINAPDATIRSLDLQRGALVIDGGSASGSGDGAAAAGAPAAEAGSAATAAAAAAAPAVVVEGVTVDNAGWEWRPLPPDEACAEEEYIRGFRVVRNETMTLP